MANSREYWQKRMQVLEDEQYQHSRQYYDDMQKQFRRAAANIRRDVDLWYERMAENNDVSYAEAKRLPKAGELEEFKWSVEDYIKAGRENAIDERWMKELENASARFHISYLEAMKLQIQQHAEVLSAQFEKSMGEYLQEEYAGQFYRTAFEVSKGTGVGFNLARLDERRIDMLIKKPWAQDGRIFSDRIWSNKEKLIANLHTELTQCIIRGESPRLAAERLAKKMNVSKAQAGTLIMTESAAIASASQRECFKELGMGQYEFDATLDGSTCKTCQGMDTKVFPMAQFEVGVTAPPVHPRCRCCVLPHFDDWEEFGISVERAARNPGTDETVYVDGKLSYPEWKEKFIDGVQKETADNEKHKAVKMGADNGQEMASLFEKSKESAIMKIKFPDDITSIKGIDDNVKKKMDDAIKEIEKEYEIHIESIELEEAGKGDIFIVGWHDGKMSMVVNRNADFEKILNQIPKRYEDGFFAGKTLEDYLAHEMFHVMMYQDCKNEFEYRAKFSQIESLYENLKGISKYTDKSKSGNEALAEAFVRMRNGENVPAIAKILVESYVGRWKR